MEVIHSEKLVQYVKDLASYYDIVTGGMDRHPQTVLANQVREASGNKIWPIEYRGSKNLNPVKDETGKNIVHFQADRTTLLDRVATRVRGRSLRMSGFLTQKQVVVDHLTNMVRDEKPEVPATWLKLSEEDHYFHSLGMGLASMQIDSFLLASCDNDNREVVIFQGVNTPLPSSIIGTKRSLATGPLG